MAFGLFSASALAQIISLGLPPVLTFAGKTSPSKLPGKSPKPIRLILDGTISNAEAPEERPLALSSLSLKFDRNGAIFTKGLATCRIPVLEDVDMVRACRKALIGHGEVEFEIKPPESPAFRTEGSMLIYNGAPQSGHPALVFRAYAHVPAATTFLTSAPIEEARGRFGTQTTIPIPKIVSGAGSLTGFRVEIGKSWIYKGRRVNLLSARCPRGRLAGYSEFEFVDGQLGKGEVGENCAMGR